MREIQRDDDLALKGRMMLTLKRDRAGIVVLHTRDNLFWQSMRNNYMRNLYILNSIHDITLITLSLLY